MSMLANVVHVMKTIQDAGPDAAPAKSHGWSHEVEVLVTVYWLACGASYRVTADLFNQLSLD